MRGHDVADFTSDLVEWVSELLPQMVVRADSGREPTPNVQLPETDQILVRLVGVDGATGPRSPVAVTHRLKLHYRFDLSIDDPVAEHQAMAELAFALLERDDLPEGHELVCGRQASLEACFALERRRGLAKAKPVRERVFDLHPNVRISGHVRAGDDAPISRAQVHIAGSDQLIITDSDGAFAFAAPDTTSVRATVKAKGRSAEVVLRPGGPNIITLAMEP